VHRGLGVLAEEPEAFISALAEPAHRILTLTVSEVGYCRSPRNGTLDVDLEDVRADLANPAHPRSTIGLIARGLAVRAAHGAPITVLSCDNLQSNGNSTRAVLNEFLEKPLQPHKAGAAHDILLLGACELLILKVAPHAAVDAANQLAAKDKQSAPFVLDPSLRPDKHIKPGAKGPYSYPSRHAARSAAAVTYLSALAPHRAQDYEWMRSEVLYSRLYMAGHLPSDLTAGTLLGDLIGDYELALSGH